MNTQAGPSSSRPNFLLEVVFNKFVTHIPIRRLRLAWLRWAGARVAPDVNALNASGGDPEPSRSDVLCLGRIRLEVRSGRWPLGRLARSNW